MITVECLGVTPPCKRCRKQMENALRAVDKLRKEGYEVSLVKKDIMSSEVMERYGILMSPAVVVNGVVKYNGKLLGHRVVERLIREEIP